MFDVASKDNRVVEKALSVTYEVEPQYDDTYQGWVMVSRHANKTYKYVNLTPDAASETQRILALKYTRKTKICISAISTVVVETLTSDIRTSRNENGSYDVNIVVSETDSVNAASAPNDPASLFTEENDRDYDESDNSMEVLDAYYQYGKLNIQIRVSGMLEGALVSEFSLKIYGQNYSITGKRLNKTTYSFVTTSSVPGGSRTFIVSCRGVIIQGSVNT